MAKVIKMMSNFHNIMRLMDIAMARLKTDKFRDAEPWMAVQPFASRPPVVVFTDKEVVFALSTRRAGLSTEIIELQDMHNDFVELVNLYSDNRSALRDLMPTEPISGYFGRTELDQDKVRSLMPRLMELNSLIDAINQFGPSNLVLSKKLFATLEQFCTQRFGADFPKFEQK
jgi:hypothetical protein